MIPSFPDDLIFDKWCVVSCPNVNYQDVYRDFNGIIYSPEYPFGKDDKGTPKRVRCFVDTMSTSASHQSALYPSDTPAMLIITELPEAGKRAMMSVKRGYIITVYPSKDASEGISYNGSSRPVIYSQHAEFICSCKD